MPEFHPQATNSKPSPTRQEVVDLIAECRSHGRIGIDRCSSLGISRAGRPVIHRRIESKVTAWLSCEATRARVDAICLEVLYLGDWFPSEWADIVTLSSDQHRCEIVPVWQRMDREIPATTHVLYLLGRRPLKVGFRLSNLDHTSRLTVLSSMVRVGYSWPHGYHGKYYTEVHCSCPVAAASKLANYAKGKRTHQ